MRRAEMTDYEQLTLFYKYVIDHTENMNVYTKWVYGQHPTDEMIRDYIKQDAMYVLEENGTILASVAVTMSQGEDYHGIAWADDLEDDDVAVVHILCVNPDYQKQKIGKYVVKECIRLAEKEDKKAVRLDALECNKPAHKLYETLGFEYRGKQYWYAGNTGWIDFYFFEYEL